MSGITMLEKKEFENTISAILEIEKNDELEKLEKINKSLNEATKDIPVVTSAYEKILSTTNQSRILQQEINEIIYSLQKIVEKAEIIS